MLCVVFVKTNHCSLTKNAILNKEYEVAIYSGLYPKVKLSLIQINGVQKRSMFEHNQTFGISYALLMLLKLGRLFHSRPHYIMRMFILPQ